MDNKICYLNTDLDLISPVELTSLGTAFDAHNIFALHVTHQDDGLWYATFETDEQYEEPELSIADMLTAIEALDNGLRSVWSQCTRREFNIGYDRGADPWAFNQGLSNELLTRISAAGASLRITLYPDRPTPPSAD